jgi:hypothetical protein
MRRLHKYVKRSPQLLGEIFCDLDSLGEIFSDPEAIIGILIAGLVLAAVVLILGGVLAAVQETIFGGGPPQGLGLR